MESKWVVVSHRHHNPRRRGGPFLGWASPPRAACCEGPYRLPGTVSKDSAQCPLWSNRRRSWRSIAAKTHRHFAGARAQTAPRRTCRLRFGWLNADMIQQTRKILIKFFQNFIFFKSFHFEFENKFQFLTKTTKRKSIISQSYKFKNFRFSAKLKFLKRMTHV